MLLVLFSLSMVGPVVADSFSVQPDSGTELGHSVPTTGSQLSMYLARPGSCSFSDPNVAPKAITFPANTAFFVRHGWIGFAEGDQATGAFWRPTTNFELYVDGVELAPLHDFYAEQGIFVKLFVINFPDGMTGTHLFQGWWFIDGYFTGEEPNTEVFFLACNLQITFQ